MTDSPVTGPVQFKPLDESLLDYELGRDIGYEYARFAMNLPDEAPAVFMEGFKHGQHSAKHKSSNAYDRKVLRLRYSAWRRNRYFDLAVDAEFLKSIDTDICPILQIPMTRGTRQDTDASVDRIVNDAAYTKGNLMYMSVRANAAKGVKTVLEIKTLVLDMIASNTETVQGLNVDEWVRLFYLALACEVDTDNYEFLPGIPCYLIVPYQVLVRNKVCFLQQVFYNAMCSSDRGKGALFGALLAACPSKKSRIIFTSLCQVFWNLFARHLRTIDKKTHTPELLARVAPIIWEAPGITELWVKWLKSLKGTDPTMHARVQAVAYLSTALSSRHAEWKHESGGYAEVNNL